MVTKDNILLLSVAEPTANILQVATLLVTGKFTWMYDKTKLYQMLMQIVKNTY